MSTQADAGARFRDTALAGFAGALIDPTHPGYEEARRVWDGRVDLRPALIVRAAGVEDVRGAVRLAVRESLPLAIRGGGHHLAGWGTCDGGITVDLVALAQVEVAAQRRVARVGGGAIWRSLDAATAVHGLATTGAVVSTVGVGGVTLGGGFGHLMRRYGLASDNLIGAQVVTADARVIYADEHVNTDLLWALRGGGGNFGVVTAFEFQLHRCAVVTGGLLLYSADKARDALSAFVNLSAEAPDELTMLAALITAPPEPFVPEALRMRPALGILVCHCADAAADPGPGAAALAPLRSAVPADADLVQPVPYAALQQMLDSSAPRGMRGHWEHGYLDQLPDEMIDGLVARSLNRPSPLSDVHVHALGGALARQGAETSPFGHRDAAFAVNVVGMWTDPADDAANVEWTRDVWSVAAPHARGAYVNFLGPDQSGRTRSAYEQQSWDRLVATKRRWDPNNVFAVNHNILPTDDVAQLGVDLHPR
jgi:FAD/FMN-containing dehydrogenase